MKIRDLNMIRLQNCNVICGKPEAAGGIISPQDVKNMLLVQVVYAKIESLNLEVAMEAEADTDAKVTRSPPIGWARQNATPLKLDSKPLEAAFRPFFF